MSGCPGVAAEDTAVYGYGLIVPRLDESFRAAARRELAGHRARGQEARALWGEADPAPAGYTLDLPLDSAADALVLAAWFEENCCAGWCAEVADASTDARRRFAVDALTAAAAQWARWRSALRRPEAIALPGFPAQA